MGNSIGMEAIIESFALSACFAVNKIEPRRALRTQRGEGDSVNMKTVTKFFAISAGLAIK